MSRNAQKPIAVAPNAAEAADPARREALRALGRFAAVTPPTVGLLLAAASRPVHANVISECQVDQVCDDT
jgi:hypothetical protein